jgi:hypothetical protein
VVGPQHHDRVLGQRRGVERVHDAADELIRV